MLLAGILLVAVAMVAFSMAVGAIALPDRSIRRRLLDDERLAQVQQESKRMQLVDAPGESARLVVTQQSLGRLEHNLMVAGHPAGWTLQHIVMAKVALPVVVLVLVGPYCFLDPSLMRLIIGVAALVVAYFTPDLLLKSRGQERNETMQRDLPDLLDKMVISIEAGLGFEAALARTAESSEGPLAEEFVRTIQDIRIGVARRDAYEALQQRTTCDDLHTFIRGIVQAEEHGSSISAMVRIQSKEMRTKRRLRAEGKAGQVSVKLLGPLMACIFPVLFVIVLSPGILNAMQMF